MPKKSLISFLDSSDLVAEFIRCCPTKEEIKLALLRDRQDNKQHSFADLQRIGLAQPLHLASKRFILYHLGKHYEGDPEENLAKLYDMIILYKPTQNHYLSPIEFAGLFNDIKNFEDANEAFSKYFVSNKRLQNTYKIAARNTRGKIYLVGGSVFRALNYWMNKINQPNTDIDFLVGELLNPMILPGGWYPERNHYGSFQLRHDDEFDPTSIDLITMSDIYPANEFGLTPSIDVYLMCVPLNVQSIAYDPEKEQLIGQAGFDAVKCRELKVHCPISLLDKTNQARTWEEYVSLKAKTLGFYYESLDFYLNSNSSETNTSQHEHNEEFPF